MKINELEIRHIVSECVKRILTENDDVSTSSTDSQRDVIHQNVNKYKSLLDDCIFIAYGTKSFDKSRIRQVRLDRCNVKVTCWNKPDGGIWASPLKTKNGWADYLEREGWQLKNLAEHYIFKVSPSSNIYVIDTYDDLVDISTRPLPEDRYGIDFEALVENGCDGIYVTEEASIYLRDNGEYIEGLYGWDVASICLFSTDAIDPITEDEFDKMMIPARGVDIDEYDSEDVIKDKIYLQMKSDYDKYGNRNVEKDMSTVFGGKHPSILAQGEGEKAETARNFNGTIKSGLKKNTMENKVIKLTEKHILTMVSESVKRILKEAYGDYYTEEETFDADGLPVTVKFTYNEEEYEPTTYDHPGNPGGLRYHDWEYVTPEEEIRKHIFDKYSAEGYDEEECMDAYNYCISDLEEEINNYMENKMENYRPLTRDDFFDEDEYRERKYFGE